MKKALMIASMASMLDNFNRSNIAVLDNMGYDITLAASFGSEDSNSCERNRSFHNEMISCGYSVKDIGFSRSLGNISGQLRSILQVKKLLKEGFDLVHCHSPICSAITRLLYSKYRKKGGKIIYTGHGFHFYKGAPLKNWLIYFPVEWLCSFFTDVLITINKEDYCFAKRHLHAKSTVYVPGIGVDMKKFGHGDRQKIRNELGISDNEIMLLSVGELNENKNHITVIKALSKLKKPPVYVIVGKGNLADHLESGAERLGVRVILTGYRSDVVDMYSAADIYILPSLREGLNVSLMEAMASGLPCIAGRIRGNVDLIRNGVNGYLCRPDRADELAKRIDKLCRDADIRKEYSENNRRAVLSFSADKVNKRMAKIYDMVLNGNRS